MVGHGGRSAGSYLTDPTSPIPSHCASIVATSTFRVNIVLLVLPRTGLWLPVHVQIMRMYQFVNNGHVSHSEYYLFLWGPIQYRTKYKTQKCWFCQQAYVLPSLENIKKQHACRSILENTCRFI